jgi:hypothetical protein
MEVLALVIAAWIAAVVLMASLFLYWTGSLFVSVPVALCVATGAALLLPPPPPRR